MSAKDGWDKWDVILKPVGGLFTAIAVASIGFFGSRFLERQQTMDTNMRLYAQLMSQREQSDSDLRKDMFQSIISTVLSPRSGCKEEKVLKLELLASNFHESLDVSPLFKHVYRELKDARIGSKTKQICIERLERAARVVQERQISALSTAGQQEEMDVDFEELDRNPDGIKVFDGDLELPLREGQTSHASIPLHFRVHALSRNQDRREINVVLEVSPVGGKDASTREGFKIIRSVFAVSPFDFPMIDNIRLPHGGRCALVLREFSDNYALVHLVYFPGSRASLKERSFYGEILNQLKAYSQESSSKKGGR
jgi:hypothetical protein